jgi:peptide/nickel transport system substrate-binding protein
MPHLTRRALLASAAAAGAVRFRPAAGADKVLTARSYADIAVIDPAFQKSSTEGDIINLTQRKLITYKAGSKWEWELDAAEKIEQPDARTITFTLKPGVKWTNGFGEMTADDVKYSFERIADPANKSPYKGDWETLDHVEVTGKLTGVIHLKEPFAPLWGSTLPWGSGAIVCKAAVTQAGGKYTTKAPAESGPFLLKEWQPKQRTTLVRNPDYNGPKPEYDEIRILPIDDEKSAEIAFQAGELDFTWSSVSSIPIFQKSPPSHGKLQTRPPLAYVWLGISQVAAPFDDIRIRQAVQKAVDVDAVLKAAYLGVAERATGIIAPGLLGHRDIKMPPRDVDGAKKLMAAAGKSNLQVHLSILNKAERATAAQVVQANLADIGIDVVIDSYDSGSYWTLGDKTAGDKWKTLQLMISRFSMAPDPFYGTEWFTPDQIGTWNWEQFDSKEFGDLHKAAIVELDTKKRGDMYVRMQDLMEQSGCYVFLTHEVQGVLSRDSTVPALLPDGRPLHALFRPA